MGLFDRLRKPKGTPVGGQFAAKMRAAADLQLQEEGGLDEILERDAHGGYRLHIHTNGTRGFAADLVRDGKKVGTISRDRRERGLRVNLAGDEVMRFHDVTAALTGKTDYLHGPQAMGARLLTIHGMNSKKVVAYRSADDDDFWQTGRHQEMPGDVDRETALEMLRSEQAKSGVPLLVWDRDAGDFIPVDNT